MQNKHACVRRQLHGYSRMQLPCTKHYMQYFTRLTRHCQRTVSRNAPSTRCTFKDADVAEESTPSAEQNTRTHPQCHIASCRIDMCQPLPSNNDHNSLLITVQTSIAKKKIQSCQYTYTCIPCKSVKHTQRATTHEG